MHHDLQCIVSARVSSGLGYTRHSAVACIAKHTRHTPRRTSCAARRMPCAARWGSPQVALHVIRRVPRPPVSAASGSKRRAPRRMPRVATRGAVHVLRATCLRQERYLPRIAAGELRLQESPPARALCEGSAAFRMDACGPRHATAAGSKEQRPTLHCAPRQKERRSAVSSAVSGTALQ